MKIGFDRGEIQSYSRFVKKIYVVVTCAVQWRREDFMQRKVRREGGNGGD
jgi:hypothetical protein